MEQEIQLEDESNTRATPNDEMKLRVKNLNVEINLHFTNRKRNSNGGLATLLHVSTSKEYK